MNKVVFLSLAIALSSCWGNKTGESSAPKKVAGLKPVYAPAQEAYGITLTGAQPIKNVGKMYHKGHFIYINEINKGIHIINNSDPSNPVRVKFIAIRGCDDISIKGNTLYAQNLGDLVALDISSGDQVVETSRMKNVFSDHNNAVPPRIEELNFEGKIYYECPDLNKGVIVGWETTILNSPQCSF